MRTTPVVTIRVSDLLLEPPWRRRVNGTPRRVSSSSTPSSGWLLAGVMSFDMVPAPSWHRLGVYPPEGVSCEG